VKRSIMLYIFSIFMATDYTYASDAFKCVVKDAKSAGVSGRLETDDFYNKFVGREFTVDRATGVMVGALKNHASYGAPKILNDGSEKKAFRVITVYEPSVAFDYLTVETYNKKSQMPFIFVSSSTVVSGICSDF